MRNQNGIRLTHEGYLLQTPENGVHDLVSYITPDERLFLVTHMSLAEIDPSMWSLEVGGMVAMERSFTLDDLQSLPQHRVISVHECAGSPLTPREPKRRVGNVEWCGVRLSDVLELCEVSPDASYVWSQGLEWGEFAGLKNEPFVKDLPIDKALSSEVLLALGMNGEPLSSARGGPVRLVVPGWYGTNSVKWIGRITLAAARAPGPYTTKFYNDEAPEGRRPVWAIAPESVIVTPAPDDRIYAGEPTPVSGWAWSEAGVALVEVSVDGGNHWLRAALGERDGFSWQRFEVVCRFPSGHHTIAVRCFNADGQAQPETSARNAIHVVTIDVP